MTVPPLLLAFYLAALAWLAPAKAAMARPAVAHSMEIRRMISSSNERCDAPPDNGGRLVAGRLGRAPDTL